MVGVKMEHLDGKNIGKIDIKFMKKLTIKSPQFSIIITHSLNNMSLKIKNSLELPGIFWKLPKGITLESLYQISEQSIWFLIWILKKNRFWSDLTRKALEEPFMVERDYSPNGQIHHLVIIKNYLGHGVYRSWYENGQISMEDHWKDGKLYGSERGWSSNGQLLWVNHY